MTRNEIKSITQEVEAELNRILQKYNMSSDTFHVKYSDNNIKFTFNTSKKNAAGVKIMDPQLNMMAIKALQSPANPNCKQWLGTSTVLGEKMYVDHLGLCLVEDFNTKARAYPFIVVTAEGKHYKAPATAIHIC
jgi:hypothetical protein